MKAMRRIVLFFLAVFAVVGLSFGTSPVPLSEWKFQAGDDPAWAEAGYNDALWKPIEAGSFWEGQGYSQYDGYGWYRIRFRLPSNLWKRSYFKDTLVFTLGCIDDCDQTFLNGKTLGLDGTVVSAGDPVVMQDLSKRETACQVVRRYAVPVGDPRLKWDSENVLAVRVYDGKNGGGMYSLPVNYRMVDLSDCLVFDTQSNVLEVNADGSFCKTITLKTLPPLQKLKGELTALVSYVDIRKKIVEKTYKLEINGEKETGCTIRFKCDPSIRTKITYTFTESKTKAAATASFVVPCRIKKPKDDEKGAYYDYTKTYAPERPWVIRHDLTLQLGSYLSDPDLKNGGTKLYETFEQALQRIIELDNITRGIPKTWVLVGWQYAGHDDKYPAFFEVNPVLKRPEDSTALQSFLWLKKEAAKHHTLLTVHINMADAYKDSPLWDTYVKNDLICRNEDGALCQTGIWNDRPAFQVCYTREWDAGFTQKRLDSVVNMLQLQSSGTVHIDAFMARESKYHGITRDLEMQAMRKIFRYLRDKGIDVTSECQAFDRLDPFIGLQPWALWFDLTREQRTAIPHDLVYGGGFGPPWLGGDAQYAMETAFLFCGGADWKAFCVNVAQMYYQNCRTLLAYDKDAKTTSFSGGLVVNAGDWTVKENGRLLRTGNDAFIPILWQKDREIMAFSEKGYVSRTWQLPPDWSDVKAVDTYLVTKTGMVLKAKGLPVDAGCVTLLLEPLEELSIQPSADR